MKKSIIKTCPRCNGRGHTFDEPAGITGMKNAIADPLTGEIYQRCQTCKGKGVIKIKKDGK